MSEYVIITDTSADIPASVLDKGQIHLIPMVYQLNGEEHPHKDPGSWDSKAFYDQLRNGGTGSTSQISPAVYTDYFEPFLKEGKDILYISLSGGLTSTWQSSHLAATDLMEEYPERKISCVDSLAATGGQGILVILAAQNQEKGMSLEENTAWLEENRLHICHWFTVDDLDFLKRGGRISPTIAWIGGKLKIKPVLRIAEDGTLAIPEKVRGSKAAMNTIVSKYVSSGLNEEHPYVFLCHGDALEQAEKAKAAILEAVPGAQVNIRYHPDNYQNNPLADLAEEKMKEINEAYETITKQRSGGGGSYQRPSGGYGGQSYGGGYQYSHQQSGSANPTYARIRNLINSGDLGTAERLLNEVPQKNGEWYFLSGSIAYRKGWLDEAMQNYSLACQMDPGNMEYRQALAMMQQGGQAYRPYGYSGGMDGLDCCTSLLCLNCLCGGGHC